jgi:hypothetical protein
MIKHTPIIEELDREMKNVAALALNARQVLVTRHPPGGPQTDVTALYEEGLRKASDALPKAATALKNVDAARQKWRHISGLLAYNGP